jgi:hypothetical protein
MNNREKILPSRRFGKTRRTSRRNRGRRETSLPFSEIVLKDNHLLESPKRLKWVYNCQGRHLWSVGVVKETIGTEISPTKMIKREPFTMFSKMKQWRKWVVECQGST